MRSHESCVRACVRACVCILDLQVVVHRPVGRGICRICESTSRLFLPVVQNNSLIEEPRQGFLSFITLPALFYLSHWNPLF